MVVSKDDEVLVLAVHGPFERACDVSVHKPACIRGRVGAPLMRQVGGVGLLAMLAGVRNPFDDVGRNIRRQLPQTAQMLEADVQAAVEKPEQLIGWQRGHV